MKYFSCDFETTTDADDCRVWAFACCEIGNSDNFLYGNSLDGFMKWCANAKENVTCYFHNLKFDGSFIVDWLLHHEFEHVLDKKDRHDKSFTSLITDMGQWYKLEIWFKIKGHKVNKVIIQDSLKILNFSVDFIASKKGFNLPQQKLKIDYKAKREVGHELTPEEVAYIHNDVWIMAEALDIMFKQNLKKMTIASDALHNFKDTCPNFKKYFPALPFELDDDMRPAYKGGFTFVNPVYQDKEVGHGLVLDVNSLYPSRLYNEFLPVGLAEPFRGKYKQNSTFPLYMQRLDCIFELKPNKIPSLQIKHHLSFRENEYLTSSKGQIVTLMLTNPDLELLFQQYDVEVVSWNGGYMFKQQQGLFKNYIDYWMQTKIQAKKDGNQALYLIAKVMQNATYGKFGASLRGRQKIPTLINGETKYIMGKEEKKEGVYLPVAAFVTSYARRYTISSIEKVRKWGFKHKGYDVFAYADTDSQHLLIDESDLKSLCDIIKIDDFELGAWKHESSFTKAKFIRQKCYIEQDAEDGQVHVTIAGFPKKLGHLVNFDNFKIGFTTEGMTDEQIGPAGRKLRYKRVKGGVLLVDTDFTLK